MSIARQSSFHRLSARALEVRQHAVMQCGRLSQKTRRSLWTPIDRQSQKHRKINQIRAEHA
jgi:hypothetical protein